jgi:uncharacterized protein (DUF983 family)
MTPTLSPSLATADVAPLADEDDRPTRPAVLRGWRGKCPNCGAGPLMRGYLKVHDNCPVCQEDLHHQRADDGPAYVTIVIVGHLMAPLMMLVFTTMRPDPWIAATLFSVGCVALSLWLLPRIKGAFVGLQWAKRMHGFGKPAAQD